MAEKRAESEQAEEEEDYMGDLSLFLPPESISKPSIPSKKISNDADAAKTLLPQSSSFKKQSKSSRVLSWQEQRKINRAQKQREEDEETLARCDAAIPSSNIGFKLLRQMGYTPGSALGKDGSGQAEPVGIKIRRSRAGLGRESPEKEKARREEAQAERKRRKVEDLMADFGSRQRLQWRIRRIATDFDKAKKALAQLENEEIFLEPEKEGDGDGEGDEKAEEEEEEEEITEEDLLDILMKLRNEHCYCLYCGCQYESLETLSSNCPGLNEEDH
ncbi:G patch domain-containing protein 11 [Cinnamomum micranthum f. kanehirae]|uniref:G patch domain-containing protein 11 n=1 Tax=Cinnamomum micranthum f. kanehirae TaxID=337451 RepID=A0A443NH19_9MAGN|nr:G patch domain-containing protein 11 [Cinnamomum micranthum f. kanehirae]